MCHQERNTTPVVDTDVWVLAEKSSGTPNLTRWAQHGGAYMSAVTAGELLVGVERVNTTQRKAKRAAFVENLLTHILVLGFSLPVSRTHARMLAALPKNLAAGAHDALISATVIRFGYALLTRNVTDFEIFQSLALKPSVPSPDSARRVNQRA